MKLYWLVALGIAILGRQRAAMMTTLHRLDSCEICRMWDKTLSFARIESVPHHDPMGLK